MNIQQQTTSEVADTETVMDYNEDLDPPQPQDISNVFATEDLSSQSSSDSDKYKRAWYKARLIRSYILSTGDIIDAFSRALSISTYHTKISPIIVGDRRHLSQNIPMQLPDMKKMSKYFPCNISR